MRREIVDGGDGEPRAVAAKADVPAVLPNAVDAASAANAAVAEDAAAEAARDS